MKTTLFFLLMMVFYQWSTAQVSKDNQDKFPAKVKFTEAKKNKIKSAVGIPHLSNKSLSEILEIANSIKSISNVSWCAQQKLIIYEEEEIMKEKNFNKLSDEIKLKFPTLLLLRKKEFKDDLICE